MRTKSTLLLKLIPVTRVACAGVMAVGCLCAATPRGNVARANASSLMRGFAGEPLAADSLRPLERSFLEKAVEVSRQRVQLARLAASQANSSEVRGFAQQLAGDSQQIGDSVDALRRRKGAVAETPAAESKDIISEAQQKLAQKSGADFDREFVRFAGEQHSEMLALFEQAAANAKDGDVRELAGGFLPMLREHYNRIVELRKALE